MVNIFGQKNTAVLTLCQWFLPKNHNRTAVFFKFNIFAKFKKNKKLTISI